MQTEILQIKANHNASRRTKNRLREHPMLTNADWDAPFVPGKTLLKCVCHKDPWMGWINLDEVSIAVQ